MANNEVPICDDHDFTQFEEEYYGYRCPKCRMFIAYGCEPWTPDSQDPGSDGPSAAHADQILGKKHYSIRR